VAPGCHRHRHRPWGDPDPGAADHGDRRGLDPCCLDNDGRHLPCRRRTRLDAEEAGTDGSLYHFHRHCRACPEEEDPESDRQGDRREVLPVDAENSSKRGRC